MSEKPTVVSPGGPATMQYNFLGRSGLRVSNIALGTMTFGESSSKWPNQSNEEYAHKMLDHYAAKGGNFIDTADIYGQGQSEAIVGSWLSKQDREKMVVATKVRFLVPHTKPAHANQGGLSRRHIVRAVQNSLQKLQTDYIDLYQMHCWDSGVPLEETLRTLDDLVRCGKVRYLGASNLKGWQLQKIVDLSRKMDYCPFISLQQQYSLLSRESEVEAFEVCENEGLGVLAWSPLKGGILTGKYKRENAPTSDLGRIGWVAQDEKRANLASFPSWSRLKNDERIWDLLDAMETIAGKHEKTVAQIALRWLLQKKVVTSVIVGATSLNQLDSNLEASAGWTLSEEEMSELNRLSSPGMEYPYSFTNKLNEIRSNPFYPNPKTTK